MKRLLFVLSCICMGVASYAQDSLNVTFAEREKAAVINQKMKVADRNGNMCAVVQVSAKDLEKYKFKSTQIFRDSLDKENNVLNLFVIAGNKNTFIQIINPDFPNVRQKLGALKPLQIYDLKIMPVVQPTAKVRVVTDEMKKELKAKLKQLKKEKWTVYGSSKTLETVLASHYEKLEMIGENGYEIMGEASKFKSMNVGKQTCLSNASAIYARESGSHFKGRFASQLESDSRDMEAEVEQFKAAYESNIERELKGELRESFTLVRTNKDGSSSMQVYYIVNEEAAMNARVRAYDNAVKDSDIAKKYAVQVSGIVKEGVIAQ